MITFSPIQKNIQETLFEKMNMLDRNTNYSIGSTRSNEKGVSKNYMFARSTWLKMVSLTQVGKNKPVILMGGEADDSGNLVSNVWGTRTSKEVAATKKAGKLTKGLEHKDFPGVYTATGEFEIHEPAYTQYDTKHGKYYASGYMPFRPMTGIKDVSVEYKGGGMRLGATRTATINWTCWTWEELDRLLPHFLHHGKSVFLEWGWSFDGSDVMPYPLFKDETKELDAKEIQKVQQDLPEYILQQKGHYDAILGIVQNFTWTVRDDGGFDCTTTLISPGVSALQQSLKSDVRSQISFLPLLVDQTDIYWKFGGKTKWLEHSPTGKKWSGDSTGAGPSAEHTYKGKAITEPIPNEEFLQLAPYFTFQAYMRDFPNQLRSTWAYADFIQHGEVISLNSNHAETPFNWTCKLNKKGETDEVLIGTKLKTFKNGAGWALGTFCTWGWFEDNVLCRFFSKIGPSNNLISEFRSIENTYNEKGEIESQQSVKIRRSTKQFTTDTNKFLLVNDDTFSEAIIKGGGETPGRWKDWISVARFSPNESHPEKAQRYGVCKENEGFLRNVYFNAEYLKEKMADVSNIEQAVMSIWNDFSSEYGGVYQFKIDFEDNGNRLVLRDKGFAANTVKEMLDNESSDKKGDDGKFSNINKLFTFPVWERNSMVKSQNLSAKLPKRMQLAAMYGSSNTDTSDTEADSDFDDLAAKGWGKLFKPSFNDEGGTISELESKIYNDMTTGNLDYPSKRNRVFGRSDADPSEDIYVQQFDDTGKPIDGKVPGSYPGTIVWNSIKNEILEQQKVELQRRYKIHTKGDEPDTDVNVDKSKQSQAIWKSISPKTAGNWSVLYMPTKQKFNVGVTGYKKGEGWFRQAGANAGIYYLKLTDEYKALMQAEMRKSRGSAGINNNTDPVIPVELELEVDGIGGVFPGNAFQSSYLPSRYKEIACFQVTGANQRIDSAGWTTSLKGQIRVSVEQEIDEEKRKLKGMKKFGESPEAEVDVDSDKQAHEDAVSENFDSDVVQTISNSDPITAPIQYDNKGLPDTHPNFESEDPDLEVEPGSGVYFEE